MKQQLPDGLEEYIRKNVLRTKVLADMAIYFLKEDYLRGEKLYAITALFDTLGENFSCFRAACAKFGLVLEIHE